MLEETIVKISLSTEPEIYPPLNHSPAGSPVSTFIIAVTYKAYRDCVNPVSKYTAPLKDILQQILSLVMGVYYTTLTVC